MGPEYDAALSRMTKDIELIRENFERNPWYAVGALADLASAIQYVTMAYETDPEIEAISKTVPTPNPIEVMEYMHTCYVEAGINLGYWKAPNADS